METLKEDILANEQIVIAECQWCFQNITRGDYYTRYERKHYHSNKDGKKCFSLFDENRRLS